MSGRPSRAQLLRWLLHIVARQRRRLLLSFVLLLLHSACRLAQPWLVMLAIDRHLIGGRREGFWVVAGAFVGAAVLEMFARWWQQVALETAGQRALLDLRQRVFVHLQRLPTAFYDRTPVGRLVGRVTTDIEALAELFSSGVVTVLGDVVFLVAVLGLLLGLSLKLTAVTMTMVPVLVVVTMLIRTRVRYAYSAMRSRLSQLNGFLHEQVSGMPVVQLFGQQDRRAGEFAVINAGVREAQLTTMWWESVLSASTEMLGSFTVALILWYGGGVVSAAMAAPSAAAAGALTLGALFAFVDYMHKFFAPLNDLSMKYTVLQNALVASERVFVLCAEPQEPPDPAAPATTAGRGGVLLQNVTFGYAPDQPVLRDVSFTVAPGESVALVGATGAGKSTILGLLTRHYDPQQGVVALDGVDVRQLARADLRRRIGVVPQDAFLFHGTILDNVRLGEAVGTDQAAAAADRVHLDEIAARFPRGYEEPIAERGKNLSAGERQLVAFARMLVRSPEVLLLDEATSNIDSHTEELLQDATRRLMTGRTTLIVAHRLSTIRDADRILVLHEGRLVEEGRHAELLARRGPYWRLYRLQYAGQEG